MATGMELLTNLANSIRTKTGATGTKTLAELKTLVDGITPLSSVPTQGATTITPGTSAKTAVAAGRYTTGAVTVAGDGDLVAGNIKTGVNIFGVTGTLIPAVKTLPYSLTTGQCYNINTEYGDAYFTLSDLGKTDTVFSSSYYYIAIKNKTTVYGPVRGSNGLSLSFGSGNTFYFETDRSDIYTTMNYTLTNNLTSLYIIAIPA